MVEREMEGRWKVEEKGEKNKKGDEKGAGQTKGNTEVNLQCWILDNLFIYF